MTVNAHMEHGKLVLENPVSFPEGTKLIVQIEPVQLAADLRPGVPTHGFWDSPTLDEIVTLQGRKRVEDPSILLGGWPGEVDDGFEDYVRRSRQSGSVGVE